MTFKLTILNFMARKIEILSEIGETRLLDCKRKDPTDAGGPIESLISTFKTDDAVGFREKDSWRNNMKLEQQKKFEKTSKAH